MIDLLESMMNQNIHSHDPDALVIENSKWKLFSSMILLILFIDVGIYWFFSSILKINPLEKIGIWPFIIWSFPLLLLSGFWVFRKRPPLLIIDHEGIFSSQIKTRRIPWSRIKNIRYFSLTNEQRPLNKSGEFFVLVIQMDSLEGIPYRSHSLTMNIMKRFYHVSILENEIVFLASQGNFSMANFSMDQVKASINKYWHQKES